MSSITNAGVELSAVRIGSFSSARDADRITTDWSDALASVRAESSAVLADRRSSTPTHRLPSTTSGADSEPRQGSAELEPAARTNARLINTNEAGLIIGFEAVDRDLSERIQMVRSRLQEIRASVEARQQNRQAVSAPVGAAEPSTAAPAIDSDGTSGETAGAATMHSRLDEVERTLQLTADTLSGARLSQQALHARLEIRRAIEAAEEAARVVSSPPAEDSRPALRARFLSQIRSDSFFAGSDAERDFLARAGNGTEADQSQSAQQQPAPEPVPQPQREPEAEPGTASASQTEEQEEHVAPVISVYEAARAKLMRPDDILLLGLDVSLFASRIEILAVRHAKREFEAEMAAAEKLGPVKAGLADKTGFLTPSGQANMLRLEPTNPASSCHGNFVQVLHARWTPPTSANADPSSTQTSLRIAGVGLGVDSATHALDNLFESCTELGVTEASVLNRLAALTTATGTRADRLAALSELSSGDLGVLRDLAMRRLHVLRTEGDSLRETMGNIEPGLPTGPRKGSEEYFEEMDPAEIRQLLQECKLPAHGVEYSIEEKDMILRLWDVVGANASADLKLVKPARLMESRVRAIKSCLRRMQDPDMERDWTAISLARLSLTRLNKTRDLLPAALVAVFAVRCQSRMRADLEDKIGIVQRCYANATPEDLLYLARHHRLLTRPGFANFARKMDSFEGSEEDMADPTAVERLRKEHEAAKPSRTIDFGAVNEMEMLPIALLQFGQGQKTAAVEWSDVVQMANELGTRKVLVCCALEGVTMPLAMVSAYGWVGCKTFESYGDEQQPPLPML